jgi:Co/Zn/Cd efflux system component
MPSLPKVGRHAQRELVEERQRAKDSLLDKPCVTGGQWKPPSFYCLGPLSGDAKTYITCFVLFLFMAVIQYIYGAQAHSAALKADSISMGGDSISYFGNLIAELWDGPQKRNIEFIAGGASSLLLLGWTIDFTVQAITRINEARRGNCGPAVDGTIVMWFAVSNLVFDFASLAVYVYVSKLPKSKKALPKSSLSDEGSDGGDMVCNLPTEREDQKVQIRSWAIPGANMRSAMLHVLADTARSMVTFVSSVKNFVGCDARSSEFIEHHSDSCVSSSSSYHLSHLRKIICPYSCSC